MLIDDSVQFAARGYRFSEHMWRRAASGARALPMRFLGRPALLLRGAQGVEVFYDEGSVARHGAMPAPVQNILFGEGSVHSLDGADHRHRKATFVDVAYEDAEVARLTPPLEREWRAERDAWLAGGRRTAYDAAVGAFGRASMRWAGLPGTSAAQTRWSARLAQIVDGFGAPYSPAFLQAMLNRAWSDRHAQRLIEAARAGTLSPREGTALHAWAAHRDRHGELLPARLAGIELQNSIRPMIAVARFVAFAARRLREHPDWRARIAQESADRDAVVGGPLATAFAQEIRRTSPFVPMLPGWATTDILTDGHLVPRGGRVVLDILGSNTDPQSWERPDDFDPDRFVGVEDYEALPAFIPHGGARVETGHRCPGEKLAIAGLGAAIAVLSDPRLEISDARLGVNLHRLPTMPSSGGIVRAKGAGGSRCPFH